LGFFQHGQLCAVLEAADLGGILVGATADFTDTVTGLRSPFRRNQIGIHNAICRYRFDRLYEYRQHQNANQHKCHTSKKVLAFQW